MKRNMDLIRAMLFEMEAHEHGYMSGVKVDGYKDEEIKYHAYLLGEVGLANVIDITCNESESPQALVHSLTWAGHEFLDSAREDNIWNQAKEKITKVGGASLPIWIALLTELIKKQIGF